MLVSIPLGLSADPYARVTGCWPMEEAAVAKSCGSPMAVRRALTHMHTKARESGGFCVHGHPGSGRPAGCVCLRWRVET